jgi:hypothetical protein
MAHRDRSGVHLTGKDSGWPVGGPDEPDPHKDGSGSDPFPDAESVGGSGEVTPSFVQTVTLIGVAGGSGSGSGSGDDDTWTLTLDRRHLADETTAPLAPTATHAQVETALEALASVTPSDVAVTGDPGGPYTVTFAASEIGQLYGGSGSGDPADTRYVPILIGHSHHGHVEVTDPRHSG